MRARIWAAGAGTVILTSALVAGIAAAASAAPVTGPEDFTIVVTGNRPQLFTAEGTLNATGTAVPVIMNGANGGVDEIHLPGGTFTLTLQNTITPTGGPPDPATCVSTFDGTGTSTISDGTGRFAGITGSGTFTFHGIFIGTGTPPNCSLRTIIDVVRDQGTLTLP